MRVFLWFALFHKRTESRLSFLFFYGKIHLKVHLNFYLLAYFNEIPTFIVLLFLFFFFFCCFFFNFFYGKVLIGDDSCTGIFNEIPPFIVCLLCSQISLLCILIFRQLTLFSIHLLYFEWLCFYADNQQYVFCLFL